MLWPPMSNYVSDKVLSSRSVWVEEEKKKEKGVRGQEGNRSPSVLENEPKFTLQSRISFYLIIGLRARSENLGGGPDKQES